MAGAAALVALRRRRTEIIYVDVTHTPTLSAANPQPLRGTRVVVTRASADAAALSAPLRLLGADMIEVPMIRIEPLALAPLRAAIARLGDYGWLAFTSRNAVEIFWRELQCAGLDAAALAGATCCAVGPATAASLEAHGIAADVVAERFDADGMAAALGLRTDVRGARVLFAKAERARDVLPRALRSMGAAVDELPVYRTVPDGRGAAELRDLLERGAVDLITLTSGSTVRHLVDAVGADLARLVRGVSIGPSTTAVAAALGVRIVAEAEHATTAALVAAVVHAAADRSR